jgi:hypothetical protein
MTDAINQHLEPAFAKFLGSLNFATLKPMQKLELVERFKRSGSPTPTDADRVHAEAVAKHGDLTSAREKGSLIDRLALAEVLPETKPQVAKAPPMPEMAKLSAAARISADADWKHLDLVLLPAAQSGRVTENQRFEIDRILARYPSFAAAVFPPQE